MEVVSSRQWWIRNIVDHHQVIKNRLLYRLEASICELGFNLIFSSNVKYHSTGQLKAKRIARLAKLVIENGQDQNEEGIRFDSLVRGHHQVTHHQPIEVKMSRHINPLQGVSDTVHRNQK